MKIYLLILTLTLFAASCGTQNKQKKPNVIFILADDYGIMDSRAYAHHFTGTSKDSMYYETPNIDRLISEGIAFDQAYATQLCSPTRASLLTGKYPARIGFTTATPPVPTYYNQNIPVPEGSYIHDAIYHSDNIPIQQAWRNGSTKTALPAGTPFDNGRDEVTIAEAMNEHHSYFIGKWHIGGHGAEGYTPNDQGFESDTWLDSGSSPFFNWRNAWNQTAKTSFPDIPQEHMHRGAAGAESGEEYLTDDLTVRALEYIEKRAKLKDKPFFLYLSHFAVHAPFQSKTQYSDHFENKTTKSWNNHDNATYAGMIRSLDESVGKILDKLEETSLDENTLVVFMSDNGGIDKKVTPNGIVTDNSPFKGGKANVSEGGIRVPLAFRWKGKISGGQWSHVAVDCNDIFPTILESTGYDVDPFYNGLNPIDGRSLFGLFNDPKNKAKTYDRHIRFWHYPFNVKYNDPFIGLPQSPQSVIREGDYKLIFDWQGKLYLFNIEQDKSETHNLADEKPELTRDLFNKLAEWLEANVEKRYWPQQNPDYQPENELRPFPFRDLLKENNL